MANGPIAILIFHNSRRKAAWNLVPGCRCLRRPPPAHPFCRMSNGPGPRGQRPQAPGAGLVAQPVRARA